MTNHPPLLTYAYHIIAYSINLTMSTIQLISANAEKINTEEKVIRVTINKMASPFEYRKFVYYMLCIALEKLFL